MTEVGIFLVEPDSAETRHSDPGDMKVGTYSDKSIQLVSFNAGFGVRVYEQANTLGEYSAGINVGWL